MANRFRILSGKIVFKHRPTLADLIDIRFGPSSRHELLCNPRRPRPKRPHGYWKKNADIILNEMVGDVGPWQWSIFFDRTKIRGPMRPEYLWLLDTIHPRGFSWSSDFHVALAKDLGLYPMPRWYRVNKRLLGRE